MMSKLFDTLRNFGTVIVLLVTYAFFSISAASRPTARVAGENVSVGSLSAARAAGLAVVHQELMLFPDRTVEENVFASFPRVMPV